MQRVTTLLDVLGTAGLSVAAWFAVDWTAGVAVGSVGTLVASWQLSAQPRKR